MKIKIERRWSNLPMAEKEEIVYDVYHGFGRPMFCPIFTKWVCAKAALSADELERYLYPYMFGFAPENCEKIILNFKI